MDLQSVVAPVSKEDFLQNYWPHRPLTIPGGSDRLADIKSLPVLTNGETVLDAYPDRVSLMRPDGFWSDASSGADAIEHYRTGHTCYLRRVERYVPEIAALVTSVTEDLGMPAGSFTGEIFCSTAESGVGMHSDYDVNFAMLLKGEKHWRFTPNESIRNQTNICLPSTLSQVDDTQLEFADHLPFPARMPDDAEEVEMRPGGLVFIPRGLWHQTRAVGECIQLNIVMKGPHWVSVLTKALGAKLIKDPDWREYAYGVCGDTSQRESAEALFTELVKKLQADFQSADARQLARTLINDSGIRTQS
ncbi:cupin domain-containing protein [Kitasatospora aureofaciens]|uniref:JmjC domain-containing protein n=1 Tax=Kitasatospora aureofaciens TaxID=1894 RepID=UPI003409B0C4